MPEGSMPPGRILKEIRRMCIDLRLALAGISEQGQQVACVPYGEEADWKLGNSGKGDEFGRN